MSLEIKIGIQMWFHCGNSVLPLQAMQANQYFEGDQGRVIDGPAVDAVKQNDQSLEEEDDEEAEEDNDNENVVILAHFPVTIREKILGVVSFLKHAEKINLLFHKTYSTVPCSIYCSYQKHNQVWE